eukprot:TRINITY_DN6920_c0_g1_i1.p1 TRINITY_DN6920_c0_g1~~TRINITY_DN6920_c0_g1_i1.p1  ORF type:complete len:400 (+),score=73.41 TRINITY_DN6920_c0_g1_i1:51-1202(+)
MTRGVYVMGSGLVKVTRGQGATLAAMGKEAVEKAVSDSGINNNDIQGLYVGNMMSGMLSQQQHLGPLIASEAKLCNKNRPLDTMTIESCCGAGGGALRQGYLSIMSGEVDIAVVVGVEQMTHTTVPETTKSLATASHWGNEGSKGATFVSLNGILMQKYLEKYPIQRDDLSIFPITAHHNAVNAEHAAFHKQLTNEAYKNSRVVSEPIRVHDASPMCDGAAAIILCSDKGMLRQDRTGVQILSSASATDILTVAEREDPLELMAVKQSTESALAKAQLSRSDIDIFELHDAYSIMACLSLESSGFVPPGSACSTYKQAPPFSTFGGLKARGHPVGATGVYQAAEVFMQLTNTAGECQVPSKIGMTQNIGGAGSSVFTHTFAAI